MLFSEFIQSCQLFKESNQDLLALNKVILPTIPGHDILFRAILLLQAKTVSNILSFLFQDTLSSYVWLSWSSFSFSNNMAQVKLASLFLPLCSCGLRWLHPLDYIKYYPPVLKAISPHYIYLFFARNKRAGWEQFGTVVLCITGKKCSLTMILFLFQQETCNIIIESYCSCDTTRNKQHLIIL